VDVCFIHQDHIDPIKNISYYMFLYLNISVQIYIVLFTINKNK